METKANTFCMDATAKSTDICFFTVSSFTSEGKESYQITVTGVGEKTATNTPPTMLTLVRIQKEPESSVTVAVSTTQQTLSLTQGWTKSCEINCKFFNKNVQTTKMQGKMI
jgi:hypothetical protein